MTFEDFLAKFKQGTFGDIIEGHAEVVNVNMQLAHFLRYIPTEVQIVAMSLFLGQIWATTQANHLRLDDGTVVLLDFDKRIALFEATARASFVEAMRQLPALQSSIYSGLSTKVN